TCASGAPAWDPRRSQPARRRSTRAARGGRSAKFRSRNSRRRSRGGPSSAHPHLGLVSGVPFAERVELAFSGGHREFTLDPVEVTNPQSERDVVLDEVAIASLRELRGQRRESLRLRNILHGRIGVERGAHSVVTPLLEDRHHILERYDEGGADGARALFRLAAWEAEIVA